jgi:hypothetical protein
MGTCISGRRPLSDSLSSVKITLADRRCKRPICRAGAAVLSRSESGAHSAGWNRVRREPGCRSNPSPWATVFPRSPNGRRVYPDWSRSAARGARHRQRHVNGTGGFRASAWLKRRHNREAGGSRRRGHRCNMRSAQAGLPATEVFPRVPFRSVAVPGTGLRSTHCPGTLPMGAAPLLVNRSKCPRAASGQDR